LPVDLAKAFSSSECVRYLGDLSEGKEQVSTVDQSALPSASMQVSSKASGEYFQVGDFIDMNVENTMLLVTASSEEEYEVLYLYSESESKHIKAKTTGTISKDPKDNEVNNCKKAHTLKVYQKRPNDTYYCTEDNLFGTISRIDDNGIIIIIIIIIFFFLFLL